MTVAEEILAALGDFADQLENGSGVVTGVRVRNCTTAGVVADTQAKPQEGDAMPWAILISVLLDRASKGFPIISELIRRQRDGLLTLAAGETDLLPGAAPDELKAAVLAFLEGLRAKATGFAAKFVLGVLINYLPLMADQVWDSIFAEVKVGQMPVMAAVEVASAEAVAFADAAEMAA